MSETASASTPAMGGEATTETQAQTDAPTNVTADGTGGKASLMTETPAETTSESDNGSLDIKSILGDELAENQNISKFLDSENPVQEMAKSLLEAQKMVGQKRIGVPDENSTDEQRAEFFKALGVPDDAEGYGFEKPEDMPEELYNAEHAAKWAGILKENNIPKSAADALREEMFKEGLEMQQQSVASLNEALDKSFGDKKAVVSKEIGELMKTAIPDAELRETIQNSLNSEQTPAFALALGHVLQHMKKTYGLSDVNTGDGGGNSGKTVGELRDEAQKLMASPAYRDPMHKDHKSLKDQVSQMYKDIGDLTNSQNKR